MKTPLKIAIVSALALAVVGAVALKQKKSVNPDVPIAAVTNGLPLPANLVSNSTAKVPSVTNALPRLLDLGATKCIPCKMMAPILEELKKDYAGRLDVEFIDVWQNPDAGKAYRVEMIPTQIFYDAQGKELFRHTGFFAKEDILAKWTELGIKLAESK